ncbi:MAG: hypothetical protein HGA81_10105 [Chlorobium limicola]|uniref:hypothetical protein n=1 Tax=Chlorobium limicola TaxID=1092 RepID=UPI0023F53F93|nr:hypothetical protein [Chlorobium limicola]NTV08935.1 hypothetical protein [Chlorobium limicola]NTV20987.1 hypothetical protein [Chlorobium limicola]
MNRQTKKVLALAAAAAALGTSLGVAPVSTEAAVIQNTVDSLKKSNQGKISTQGKIETQTQTPVSNQVKVSNQIKLTNTK